MKNHLPIISKSALLIAFAAIGTSTSAQALFKPTPQKTAATKLMLRQASSNATKPAPLHVDKKKASSESAIVLVNEDFSKMSAGTSDKPDTSTPLANEDSSIYIDPSLTSDGSWAGTGVYSAGGSCALISPDGETVAELLTPLGDYSGEITVTCRIKAIPVERDGETVNKGSTLDIVPYIGGYMNGSNAKTDAGDGYSIRVYPKQGWNEVKFTFSNYSANNNGFIAFATQNGLVIDDIKITSKATFIAQPAILPATSFKSDGFTINWEPVLKAYDYCIDLYKKVYTTDGDARIKEDFNNNSLKNDWTISHYSFSPDGGANGTPALLLNSGDSIATPYNYSKYKFATFFMKVTGPADLDKYSYGDVYIDVLNEDGWQQVGTFMAGGFTDGRTVDIDQSLQYAFAGNYYGFRLRPELSEGCQLILDDFDMMTGRAGYLEPVFGDNSMQYGGDDTYYDDSQDCSYTFSGLDPNTEYYYRVRSHYIRQFSKSNTYHALGVSSPESLEATDVKPDGYTAQWQAAPKATSYTVSDYTVYTAAQDEHDHTLLEETFDKVDDDITEGATDLDDMVTLSNYTDTNLDEYADNNGWTGTNNGMINGMLGCDYNYYYGYLQTPELNTANNDEFTVNVKAYGYFGDDLLIYTADDTYTIPFDDQGDGYYGYLDKSITLKSDGKNQKLVLLTNAGAPFAIDYFKVSQDIKAGTRVLKFNTSADVDADSNSWQFKELNGNSHAFCVTSHYLYDGTTVSSDPSDYAYVNLDGTSGITSHANSAAHETARYSIDGRKLCTPVRGINIVKMSDGKVKKVVVK